MNQLFSTHPYWVSIIGTFLVNNVATAFVGSFPAPTKDSSPKYIFWFKFSNTVIGNIKRAQSTALEQSPNFQDVKAKIEQNACGTAQ